MSDHSHHGACPLLVWAAITHESPTPPDISDNPPLHIFTMSIGMMIGRMLAQGKITPKDAMAAASWAGGKKTPQEIIDLIWGN
jgi:hypothetical protein